MGLRKVHFYRANAGTDSAGVLLPFDALPHLRDIHVLPFVSGERYMQSGDNELLCCWVDQFHAPYRSHFGRIRRSNLPQLERAGALSPLSIPDDSGVVEHTHVVFFPDNIVGSLFNFYGPRVPKLAVYLKQKSPSAPRGLRFDPLLRQDVLAQLDKLDHVQVLDLNVHRSYVQVMEQADINLGEAFSAAERASGAEQIHMILKPRPRKRSRLRDTLLSTVKTLAANPFLREDVSTFKVKGVNRGTDRLETIDVLRDHFVVQKEVAVVTGRHRQVDQDSAYGAIEAAYVELQDQLKEAASMSG